MLRAYYDTEWGMPVRDEQGIFERISLKSSRVVVGNDLRKRPAVWHSTASTERSRAWST